VYLAVGEFVAEVNVEVRYAHKDGVDLWLQKMAVVVDTDSLVVDRALSSVLDLILEVQEAFEVVNVGAGVVEVVLAGTDQQIQDFPGGIGCNIAVDYART
jgi:hypothetical protein